MKITIQYRDDKTSKTGQPFLSLKDTQGQRYSCWESYLFHLMVVGATLDVTTATKGNFTNITGVIGQSKPNESGGITVARSEQPSPIAQWLEKIYGKMSDLEKKVDWLIQERKTITSLPPEEKKEELPPF